MSGQPKPARTERRKLVTDMLTADATRSNRSIARACGCSHELVRIVRGELEQAGNLTPRSAPNPATRQNGNVNLIRTDGQSSGNLQHGAYSTLRLASLRSDGETWARTRWPWLDDTRVALIADLGGRIELARTFVDEKGLLRHRGRGTLFPIAEALHKWETHLSTEIKALDAEGRERKQVNPADALHAHLAEIEAGR